MTGTVRDRGRGAGYEYQWDVATHFLLLLLAKRRTETGIDRVVQSIGDVTAVHLDGDAGDERLEDLNLYAPKGSLRIQVKERDPFDSWKKYDEGFLRVLGNGLRGRVGHNERVVLLSNVGPRAELRETLRDGASFDEFYNRVQKERAKKAKKDPKSVYYKALGDLPALITQ